MHMDAWKNIEIGLIMHIHLTLTLMIMRGAGAGGGHVHDGWEDGSDHGL